MRWIVGLLLACCAAPVLAQDSTAPTAGNDAAQKPVLERSQVLANSVIKVIQPGFVSFKVKAKGLDAAMSALCAAPGAETVAAADTAFAAAVDAYSRIEFFKVGPLVEQNRAERLLFWPDAKGIGLRQVQQILGTKDETATTPDGLQQKSVGVQGLGALEFVLFGTGSDALKSGADDFRCRYGRAIAQSAAQIASDMTQEWLSPDGISNHLMDPKPEFTDYRTKVEALEEIVGTMSHGVEALRDTRLLPFIGRDGKAAPKQALFWRSGLSMAAVRANIEGLETVFDRSQIAQAIGPDQVDLENSIQFEFHNAYRAIDLVTSPVAEAVNDPKQLAALNYLVIVTESLESLLGEQLSAALSLSVGFSALDGD